MSEKHTPGPLGWQKMGNRWCLVGQYGMRPIILSATHKGELMLRDAATDRLIPFDPSHPDARMLAAAPAMDLMLQMLRLGIAQFDGSTNEFRFNGLRYPTYGDPDWSKTVAVLGWDKCRAIAKSTTGGQG